MENVGSRTQEALRQTKPWVRMFSVLFMFVGAMMLLMAVVVGGFSLVGSAFIGEAGLPGGMMSVGVAFLYGVMSLLYLMPGLHLWRYASAIGRMLLSENVDDLAEALEFQRSFWKFTGVMFLILIVLYFVIFAVMIVFAIFSGAAAS